MFGDFVLTLIMLFTKHLSEQFPANLVNKFNIISKRLLLTFKAQIHKKLLRKKKNQSLKWTMPQKKKIKREF